MTAATIWVDWGRRHRTCARAASGGCGAGRKRDRDGATDPGTVGCRARPTRGGAAAGARRTDDGRRDEVARRRWPPLALAVTLVAAGFGACCLPATTQLLAQATANVDGHALRRRAADGAGGGDPRVHRGRLRPRRRRRRTAPGRLAAAHPGRRARGERARSSPCQRALVGRGAATWSTQSPTAPPPRSPHGWPPWTTPTRSTATRCPTWTTATALVRTAVPDALGRRGARRGRAAVALVATRRRARGGRRAHRGAGACWWWPSPRLGRVGGARLQRPVRRLPRGVLPAGQLDVLLRFAAH